MDNFRKTVSFEEQMMSKDKYLCILRSQMEAIILHYYPSKSKAKFKKWQFSLHHDLFR